MVRHLYHRGFERRDVQKLFRFIDWLMVLPEDLDEQVDDELKQLEGDTKMPYVTGFERRAMKRGEQRGIASVLRRLLTRRFEKIPEWAEERLENANQDELENWADRVIDAETLEQVFATS
jgi:hypothetical protein